MSSERPAGVEPLPWAVQLAALVVAVLAPVLSIAGLTPPGRPLLAVAFFLLVPGVALLALLRLPVGLVTWALILASSLAVNILVLLALMLMGTWVPIAGQCAVAAVAVVAQTAAFALRLRPMVATS